MSMTGAVFSPCRTWRYELWRRWDAELPSVAFIGLNPSTADETQDDPTIRRCIGFARSWGFGSLVMLNLFAFRATDPKVMRAAPDPVGPANDEYLWRTGTAAGLVVAAWGTHGSFAGRDMAVMHLLRHRGLVVLGRTKDGHPRHPLYVRADVLPVLA